MPAVAQDGLEAPRARPPSAQSCGGLGGRKLQDRDGLLTRTDVPPPTSPMPGGGTHDEDAVGRRGLSSHAGQHRFNSGTAALLETPDAPQRRCTGRRVAVADTHALYITVEASGEVTPAQPTEDAIEAEEAEQ